MFDPTIVNFTDPNGLYTANPDGSLTYPTFERGTYAEWDWSFRDPLLNLRDLTSVTFETVFRKNEADEEILFIATQDLLSASVMRFRIEASDILDNSVSRGKWAQRAVWDDSVDWDEDAAVVVAKGSWAMSKNAIRP